MTRCGVCFHGRFRVQSGHTFLRRTCRLLTQSGHRRCSPIQNEVDLQNAGHLSASHGTLTSKAELGFEPHSALNNPDGGMVGAHAELPSS